MLLRFTFAKLCVYLALFAVSLDDLPQRTLRTRKEAQRVQDSIDRAAPVHGYFPTENAF
jgi:hypothetical protein